MSHPVTSGAAPFEQWTVAYDTRGDSSRAIVFIHGANVDRGCWRRQLQELSTGRRLIAIDLLGHGESSRIGTGYSVGLWARSIAAVLDHLAVDGAVLVGHSNGVPVIRQFYRLYPRRVDGLIAVDGALWPPYTPQLVAWFKSMLNAPDYEQKAAALANQMPQGRLADADFAYLKRMAVSTQREANLGMLEALQDETIWTPDAIDAPLLYIAAGARPSGPFSEDKVRAVVPHAEIVVLPQCSHFLTFEEPERFQQLVEDFVNRLTTKNAGR